MAEMTMTYEFISPEYAEDLLTNHNHGNRRLKNRTVEAYVTDLKSGNWDEQVGSTISIDERGELRDGQHRLTAIVKSGIGVKLWVCRNVSDKGIYDSNVVRSISDQLYILRPDLEAVYKSYRFAGIVNMLINHRTRKKCTAKQVADYIDRHKDDLDGFFYRFPTTITGKITNAVVVSALYMAYAAGVEMDDILRFYSVLTTGMSTCKEEFPIIAYRKYLLKDSTNLRNADITDVCRCQYALKKYLDGSCTKRIRAVDKLIWPFPYDDDKLRNNQMAFKEV